MFLLAGRPGLAQPETVAPTPAEAAPAEKKPPASVQVKKSENLALVGGRPRALLWAEGLKEKEEVKDYAKAGLNVLYVGVAASNKDALSAAEDLLAAGEDHSLPALVGLDSRAAQLDKDGRPTIAVHPRSPAYQRGVRDFVSAVVPKLKGRPGVIGWIVEGLSPQALTYAPADFQWWLQANYQEVGRLNQSWGSEFTDFTQISPASPAQVDADRTGQLGRATLDLGMYYYSLYRDLLTLWAREIRRADAGHLVIVGGQGDFRSLAATPELYDGLVALGSKPRPAAEGGFEGIEAIDIARRANRFLAFGFAKTQEVSGASLYEWAGQCFVHGAAGLGLQGWERIKGDEGLRSALKRLNDLVVKAGAFPRTPRAETALLYEPLSGGPEYGFLPQAASAEPGALFRAFARGTRFGAVDYLTEDMLARTELSRYGVIFAPLAFSVSAPSQQALSGYVNGGGVLLADWGIGAYESGSLNYLPQPLADLFGVGYIFARTRTPLDIAVISPDALFPSLPFEAITTGKRVGAAFTGLVGDVRVVEGGKRFMTRYAFGEHAPSIILNTVGGGRAIFASAPLWENWQRGDGLFDEFHGDLIGRRRAVWAAGAGGLFADADVTLYSDGTVGLFRGASGIPTEVQVDGDASQVFLVRSGAQVVGSARPTLLFTGAGANLAAALPMTVSGARGLSYLQVKEYGPERVALEIHGPRAVVSSTAAGAKVQGGMEFSMSITLRSEARGYTFPAKSRHKVVIREVTDKEKIPGKEVAASESAALTVSVKGKAVEVIIEPAGKAVEE